MKFLIHEHKGIKELAESKGLILDDFSFTKRKGRLYINFQDQQPEFVLFRKSETVLDENNRWSKRNRYTLFHPVQKKDITDWNEVIIEIENWMNEFC